MKVRYHSLSVYRIIATICILQFHIFFLIHNYDIPYEMLLSKGVQGLTALSGFLYASKKIKDDKEFIKNNFKKLLIPVLICFITLSSFYFVYSLINRISFIECYFSYRPFNNAKIFSFANLYYIAYIGICYLLTPLLKKNKNIKILITIFTILIELAISYFFGAAIILSTYLIGYLVGEKYFDTYVNNKYKEKIPHIIIWTLVIVISIFLYSLVIRNNETNYYIKHLLSMTDIICSTLFGVATFFLFISLFAFINNSKTYKFFLFTDKYCYFVYILNQVFMSGVSNVSLISNNMFIKYLLIYSVTILVSYFAYYINQTIEKGKFPFIVKLN